MSKKKVWKRNEPDSPCQDICLIHPQAKLCIGCYRTPYEVSNWGKFSKNKRRTIMQELSGRSHLIKRRKGGRSRNQSKAK